MTPYVDFKRRSLSTGFSHVALVRNDNIYTWGSSVQGCLGTYVCRIFRIKMNESSTEYRNIDMSNFIFDHLRSPFDNKNCF